MKPFYIYNLILFSSLTAVLFFCIFRERQYLKRVDTLEKFCLIIIVAASVFFLSGYASEYSNPNSMNWKHEVMAVMINNGADFEFNHRTGYIFIESLVDLLHQGTRSEFHYYIMILNIAFFAAAVILLYFLVRLMTGSGAASLASSSFFALYPGNLFETLSCEHRIVSVFFVLLMMVSLVAYTKKNSFLYLVAFVISMLAAIECRLDNLHYFASVFAFILIFRKQFAFRFILAAVLCAVCCTLIVFLSQSNQPGFFSPGNAVHNLPGYFKQYMQNPFLTGPAIAGLILGYKEKPGFTLFTAICLIETTCFWSLALTGTLHLEFIYMVIPLSFLIGIGAYRISQKGPALKYLVAVGSIAVVVLFSIVPPKKINDFKLGQLYDMEIRKAISEESEKYALFMRAEYLYIAMPDEKSILPVMMMNTSASIKRDAGKIRRTDAKIVICFSLVDSEYDCGFFEAWKEYIEDFSDIVVSENIIEELNMEFLELEGTKAVKPYRYVKKVVLKL